VQQIHSGTTTERVVRTALLASIVVGFAIAFLWDGHAGYIRKNARSLVESLGLPPEQAPAVNRQLTASEARRIMDELGAEPPRDEILSWFGDPPLRHEDKMYYVGPGGHLWFRLERGQVREMGWAWGEYNETDLRWQRWIGYILSVAGVALILRFVKAATSGVTLTETGMKLTGRPLIPYDAMTVLRTGGTRDPDSVTLEYVLDGRSRIVRFDSYLVKEFSAILDGICTRAGFPHPRTPVQGGTLEPEASSEDG